MSGYREDKDLLERSLREARREIEELRRAEQERSVVLWKDDRGEPRTWVFVYMASLLVASIMTGIFAAVAESVNYRGVAILFSVTSAASAITLVWMAVKAVPGPANGKKSR